MRIPQKRIRKFQKYIFFWWKTNRRDLPWRRTRDPYKILVSEIMLQQTTVSRVLSKYKKFLIKFPDVGALQKASVSDVLRVWKGMGYNRRALYLKKAAKTIVEDFSNQFPISEQLLSKLTGVGKYTARAILIFAYKKDIAAVDTNIRQIITHFFFDDKPQKENVIQDVADQLVPKDTSWEWHQALMDYGALEMSKLKIKKTKKKPRIPFKQTNRYFRGRLIDRLREGALQEPSGFSTAIIDGLIKDGLVKRNNGMLSLPD